MAGLGMPPENGLGGTSDKDRSASGSGGGSPKFAQALGLVTKPFPGLWGFAGLLALAVVGQMVVASVLFAALPKKSAVSVGLVAIAASVLWVFVAYVAIRLKKLDPVRSFRIGAPALERPVLFTVLSFVLGSLIVLPAGLIYQFVGRYSSSSPKDVLDLVGGSSPTIGGIALLVFAVAVVAPVGEELFFRGMSFSGMKDNYGALPATFSVSVMFAVIHFDPAKMLSIFLLSLVLCHLVILSRSVWPAVAAHMGYNGLQVLAWSRAWMKGELTKEGAAHLTVGPPLVSLLLAAAVLYSLTQMSRASSGAGSRQPTAE